MIRVRYPERSRRGLLDVAYTTVVCDDCGAELAEGYHEASTHADLTVVARAESAGWKTRMAMYRGSLRLRQNVCPRCHAASVRVSAPPIERIPGAPGEPS